MYLVLERGLVINTLKLDPPPRQVHIAAISNMNCVGLQFPKCQASAKQQRKTVDMNE